MSKTTRRLYISFLILMGLVVFAFPTWVILIWAEESYGSVVYSSITNKTVKAGDTLNLKGFMRSPPECRVRLIRRVYDSKGTIISVPSEEFIEGPEGEFVNILRGVIIPTNAAPGLAKIHRTMEWSCNWIQFLFPRQRPLEDLEFTILPADQSE